MLILKDLVLEAKQLKDITPEFKAVLESAENFLLQSKSFEYKGSMTLQSGSVIKLNDIGMDLDDVFKMLANKKTDIKGVCELYINWQEEVVVKEETKEITQPTIINLMEGECC
jgi:hypothetical protein